MHGRVGSARISRAEELSSNATAPVFMANDEEWGLDEVSANGPSLSGREEEREGTYSLRRKKEKDAVLLIMRE